MKYAVGDIKMEKCNICNKEFSSEIGLKRHVTIMFGKDSTHCPWLVYLSKYKNIDKYSKNSLEKMYLIEKKTTPQISQELNVQKLTLLRTMKYYDIKLRNRSESTKNQITRDGVWNAGKTKYNNKSIARYSRSRLGKLNPFYTAPGYEERYKKLMNVAKKGIAKFCANRNPKTTEDRLSKILKNVNINYVRNFSINYNQTWRLFDFLIEGNLLVEMQGNYFHANPKFYKSNDIVVIGSEKRLVREIWEKDKEKASLAINSGYSLLVIWEDDFCDMTDEEVLLKIKEELHDN